MDSIIKEYLESGNALQELYQERRFGKMRKFEELTERYKPILQSMSEKLKESPNKTVATTDDDDDEVSTIGKLAYQIIHSIKAKNTYYDNAYGLREEAGGKGWYIGNQPIEIRNNNIIFKNSGKEYIGTQGLWQLVSLARPKDYSEEDLANYEEIILTSNVYRQNNDPSSKRYKSNGGYKYVNFIKPIIDKYIRHVVKEGSGLLRKKSINRPVEYVYWNTVEELLDRLCILYGEIKSGNTNPLLLNEITNILQEFKEIP